MFENIGEKIKDFATAIAIIGIGVCFIVGIVMMTHQLFFEGFLLATIGSLISWLSSFILYGFGELIDKTTDIQRDIQSVKQQLEQNEKNQ